MPMTVYSADDFINQLQKIEADTEEIAKRCINEALPILMTELQSRTAQHVDSGNLEKSIKLKKAKYNSKSNDIRGSVQYTGNGNTYKILALEYGTSRQTAQPIIAPTIAQKENEVTEKMQQTLDAEIQRR